MPPLAPPWGVRLSLKRSLAAAWEGDIGLLGWKANPPAKPSHLAADGGGAERRLREEAQEAVQGPLQRGRADGEVERGVGQAGARVACPAVGVDERLRQRGVPDNPDGVGVGGPAGTGGERGGGGGGQRSVYFSHFGNG